MNAIATILIFLNWESERQIPCLRGLAKDSGASSFLIDGSNPVYRLARVVDDLHFQREGESVAAWRERQGIGMLTHAHALDDLGQVLESLHVVFDLMIRSSKTSLFTAHGIKSAAAWRVIRRIAGQGLQVLTATQKVVEADVLRFLEDYKFEEEQ